MAYCGPTHYRPVAEWLFGSSGQVPPCAVQGGYDGGDTIYVARAHHNGDNIPGKLLPSHGCVYVSWGGEEHSHHSYEVLCNPQGSQLEWKYCGGGDVPSGAVQGGTTADGEPLYIGRHEHEGTMTVGKVQPSHQVLYIAYGGREHRYSEYEVLVCRSIAF
uniref:Methyltransferase-like protein n=1 Tax=Hadrurus spadix TaxID=141984 RepID=A0A1W7RA66_9SCOR